MDLEEKFSTSPENKPTTLNCISSLAEQNCVNMSIKDEPIDIIECSLEEIIQDFDESTPPPCAETNTNVDSESARPSVHTEKESTLCTSGILSKNNNIRSGGTPVTRTLIINGQEKSCILVKNPLLKQNIIESAKKSQKKVSDIPSPNKQVSYQTLLNEMVRSPETSASVKSTLVISPTKDTLSPSVTSPRKLNLTNDTETATVTCSRCLREVHKKGFRQHINECLPKNSSLDDRSSENDDNSPRTGQYQTERAIYNLSTEEIVPMREEPISNDSNSTSNSVKTKTQTNLESSPSTCSIIPQTSDQSAQSSIDLTNLSQQVVANSCSYAVSSQAQLQVHQRTHVKNMAVTKCFRYDFRSTSFALSAHMKTHVHDQITGFKRNEYVVPLKKQDFFGSRKTAEKNDRNSKRINGSMSVVSVTKANDNEVSVAVEKTCQNYDNSKESRLAVNILRSAANDAITGENCQRPNNANELETVITISRSGSGDRFSVALRENEPNFVNFNEATNSNDKQTNSLELVNESPQDKSTTDSLDVDESRQSHIFDSPSESDLTKKHAEFGNCYVSLEKISCDDIFQQLTDKTNRVVSTRLTRSEVSAGKKTDDTGTSAPRSITAGSGSPATINKLPYGCDRCSYVASDNYGLNRHKKTHSHNRPIKKCDRCDYKSTPQALLYHMKTHCSTFVANSQPNFDEDVLLPENQKRLTTRFGGDNIFNENNLDKIKNNIFGVNKELTQVQRITVCANSKKTIPEDKYKDVVEETSNKNAEVIRSSRRARSKSVYEDNIDRHLGEPPVFPLRKIRSRSKSVSAHRISDHKIASVEFSLVRTRSKSVCRNKFYSEEESKRVEFGSYNKSKLFTRSKSMPRDMSDSEKQSEPFTSVSTKKSNFEKVSRQFGRSKSVARETYKDLSTKRDMTDWCKDLRRSERSRSVPRRFQDLGNDKGNTAKDDNRSDESSEPKSNNNTVEKVSEPVREENIDIIPSITCFVRLENDLNKSLKNCTNLSKNETKTYENCTVSNSNINSASVLDNVNVTSVNNPKDPLENSSEVSLLLTDTTLSCSLCSFTTDKQKTLREHERNHRQSGHPIVQCYYCSQRYTRYMLYLHIQNVHPGQRFQIRDGQPNKGQPKTILKCSKCTFSTTVEGNLQVHLRKHSLKTSVEVKSSEISKNSSVSDKSSELVVAESETYSLPREENLELITLKGTNSHLLHQCKMCSYISTRKSDVTKHTKCHNDEPIEQCRNCEFKSTPKAVVYHMKKCKASAGQTDKPSKTKFRCSSCRFSTKEESKLKAHEKKHQFEPTVRTTPSGSKMYYCKMCSHCSKKLVSIRGHINSHQDMLPLVQCSNCSFKSTRRIMNIHLNKCNLKSERNTEENESSGKFQCSICCFSTKEQLIFDVHLKNHIVAPLKVTTTSGNTYYQCRLCSYRQAKGMARHIEGHKNNTPIIDCPNSCGYRSTQQAVTWHSKNCKGNLKSVHVNNEKNSVFTCHICDFATSLRIKLKLHVRKRHRTPENRFRCTSCSFVAKKEMYYKQHVKTHERNAPIKKCPHCSFRSVRTVLAAHRVTCADKSKNMNSDNCQELPQEVVESRENLREDTSHNDEHFEAKPRHRESPQASSDRRESIQVEEYPAKIYKCKQCSFTTSKSQTYCAHMKSHLHGHEIKKCEQCNFRSTPTTLLRHMLSEKHLKRKIDNGKKSALKCKLCSAVCSGQFYLKLHMETHTNQPIKKCPQCNFRSTRNCLLHHIRQNHRSGILEAEKCRASAEANPKSVVSNMRKPPEEESKRTGNEDGQPVKKSSQCNYRSVHRALVRHKIIKHHHLQKTNTQGSNQYEKLTNHSASSATSSRNDSGKSDANENARSNLKKFPCSECSFATSLRIKLKIHTRKYHQSSAHCSKDNKTKRAGKPRANNNQNNTPKVSQNDSREVFMSSPGTYACDFCSYNSRSKQHLRKHKECHLKRNLPIRQCPNCDFRSTFQALSIHLRQCPNKPETSNSKTTTKSNSEVSEVLKCYMCSYTTTIQLYLNVHLNNHWNRNILIEKCNYCDFKGNKSMLRKHAQLCQNKPREKTLLSCSKCSYSTYLPKILKHHEENTHPKEVIKIANTGPKTYKCGFCSFTSFFEYVLEKHTNSHTLLKLPIEQCSGCDFQSTPAALTAHSKQCKGTKVLSDVSVNNRPDRKLSRSTSEVRDIVKTDYSGVRVREKRKTVGGNLETNVPEGEKAQESASQNDREATFPVSPVREEITNISISTGTAEGSSNENNLGASLNSPPKHCFKCSKCSFTTHLRIKLKFHQQKKHLAYNML